MFVARQKLPMLAILLLLAINTVVLLFHIAIISKVIPYKITWGGKLKSDADMYVFEAISILVNLFFSFTLMVKAQFIRAILPLKAVNVLLWIFFAIYILNTLANLFAATTFERWLTVLTFLYALLLAPVLLPGKNVTR
jgi:hypothetical protein